MAKAAREESMEDVLASIRRLVSEETERIPDMREAVSAKPVEPYLSGDKGWEAGTRVDSAGRSAEPDQHTRSKPADRATRAKLLLTDDYLVEDIERWLENTPPDSEPSVAPPSSRRSSAPSSQADVPAKTARPARPAAETRRDKATGHINQAEDADTTAELSGSATAEVAQSDRPSLDERARARQARAERRRKTAARAAAIASDTAMRRAPQPKGGSAAKNNLEQPDPTEGEPVNPTPKTPAAQDAVSDPQMVPLSMIENVIRTSLEKYSAELVAQAAPQTKPNTVSDEDKLRQMVADIVRTELQGPLGERITRNMRKLVRREIYRALETRDLG